VHVLAVKLEVAIAEHRARQEPALEKDLKAVADAEHRTPSPGKFPDRCHDRREARDCAGPKVVAVRDLLVPDESRLLTEDVLRGVVGVVIAVRSREDDNGEGHWAPAFVSSTLKLSITGFARTRSATSAASFSAAA